MVMRPSLARPIRPPSTPPSRLGLAAAGKQAYSPKISRIRRCSMKSHRLILCLPLEPRLFQFSVKITPTGRRGRSPLHGRVGAKDRARLESEPACQWTNLCAADTGGLDSRADAVPRSPQPPSCPPLSSHTLQRKLRTVGAQRSPRCRGSGCSPADFKFDSDSCLSAHSEAPRCRGCVGLPPLHTLSHLH